MMFSSTSSASVLLVPSLNAFERYDLEYSAVLVFRNQAQQCFDSNDVVDRQS